MTSTVESKASYYVFIAVFFVFAACGTQEEKAAEKKIAPPVPATEIKVPERIDKKDAVAKDSAEDTVPKADKMVMVVVDALRADRLGCYGFDKPTTPTIDGLAKEGILFEKLYAASPWTAPSFGSLFTGVSPTVHGAGGMLSKGSARGTSLMGVTVSGIRKNLPTLPEMLPDNVRKGAIVTNAFVSSDLGFHKGFDDFDHRNASIHRYRQADEVTKQAITWLKAHKDGPFFLLIHYFDPHMKYGPPEKYVSMFAPKKPPRISVPFTDHDAAREGTLNPSDEEKDFIKGLYNGEVRFVDDQMGILKEAMEEMALLDNTWLLVTSDHGEEQFEHGSFEHGHAYEDEVTRVPLILRAPKGKWRAGTRVAASVRHVDILPTVVELFHQPLKPHFEGTSLIPLIVGDDTKDRVAYMEFNLFHGQQCAMFDGRNKIVWDTRRKRGFFYDLTIDPGETTRMDSSHPLYGDLLKALKAKRDVLKKASKGKKANKVQLSTEATKALRSLGYVE